MHLAAQPMVRRSLLDPVATYEVNVIGTANVLDAVRVGGEGVLAVLVVTSDKCYEHPVGERRPFREGDPLGGSDPYSSSKACAELLTAAYRRSFFDDPEAPRLGSARAGNVIGGGDWGEDRLVPDAVRAVEGSGRLLVRNPQAVRPWQHVLNPLGGYLSLARALCDDPGSAEAWNFGPAAEDARPVGWVVQRLAELWQGELAWELDPAEHPPEAGYLSLDSTRARTRLGWEPPLGLDRALELIVGWHEAHRRGAEMRAVSLAQLEQATA
jgi:CDP-glucose 4,6-dehydratase